MLFKVLAVGDVTGESGVDFLHRRLRSLKKEKSIDFVVANGENAAGNGLLPTHAEDILAAGVDVITLGNHSFGKTQIADFLEESPYILRPANFTGRAPGRGWAVYDCGRVQVGVMSLLFGWPGQRPVGDPYPRTHRRWANLPQGHGLSHRPGYDRAGGVCAGRPAGAIGGVFPGGAARPISDGGRPLQAAGSPVYIG